MLLSPMAQSNFNPAPLLEFIQEWTAEEVAGGLNESLNLMTDYMLKDDGINGTYAVNQVFLLRQLRDKILLGMGVDIFEK